MAADATRAHVWVTLHGAPERGIVQVGYAGADPRQAQRVTERLSSALVTDAGAELVESATLPQSPEARGYPRVSLGAAAGLGIGVIAALIMRRVRRQE
jgi:hypothetical protein